MVMALAEPSLTTVPVVEKQSYMVGGETLSADWRWPEDQPHWRMSFKEGVTWEVDGPLNEAGRQLLLRHFGLETIAAHLPLEKIATMSPLTLTKKRHTLERNGTPHLEPKSDCPGRHVLAQLAA